ncbi:jg5600 [Pararge aegeria aegeria]|uniref:Jg5600 protein n=1 Tax=Pararge aegeria aegeria TaxID=348720 RepID=A0A8S4QJK5_9NEOP|nr:jg5600 [Pararge aegeria aegeria]
MNISRKVISTTEQVQKDLFVICARFYVAKYCIVPAINHSLANKRVYDQPDEGVGGCGCDMSPRWDERLGVVIDLLLPVDHQLDNLVVPKTV